jgi:hypothetical protein
MVSSQAEVRFPGPQRSSHLPLTCIHFSFSGFPPGAPAVDESEFKDCESDRKNA